MTFSSKVKETLCALCLWTREKKATRKQCNHGLDSSNYNIKAHFLYCSRMNSLKKNLSDTCAQITSCALIFVLSLCASSSLLPWLHIYTYKIITCSSTQRKSITFQQNILILYIHEGSPGTWGTNPLLVFSCPLGSCTLGTTKEKVQ